MKKLRKISKNRSNEENLLQLKMQSRKPERYWDILIEEEKRKKNKANMK